MNEVTQPAAELVAILNEHPIESISALTVLLIATYSHEIYDKAYRLKGRILTSRGLDHLNQEWSDFKSHRR